MKIRHFLLLTVVLMSMWGFGCAPARSGMDYLESGGHGEVSGQINGMDFSALVEISPGGESVRVEYLSPDALCGLTLTKNKEECEVHLGEVCFVCDTSEVVGFLRPVTALLPQGEANSVQKEGENTILTFPSGGVLTLSPKGEPLAFREESIEMRVVWWQSGAKEIFGP
ncbi:MAG: hypothetical protein IJV73_04740 [Clostridia bacterium]|nr:hypothetical protein [Clostridia bacterium]